MDWVLQQGSGDCRKLLEVTREYHGAHCRNLGIRYVPMFDKVDPAPFSINSEGQVVLAKIITGAIDKADVQHGDTITVLDADTLWNGEDIRAALPQSADLALYIGRGFCNCGVMVMRLNARIYRFWRNVLALGPLRENNTQVDLRVFDMLKSLSVSCLRDEWNWFPREKLSCSRDKAKVLHYQGQHKDNACLSMKADLSEIGMVKEHGESGYTD